jgi:hypothetical protein
MTQVDSSLREKVITPIIFLKKKKKKKKKKLKGNN